MTAFFDGQQPAELQLDTRINARFSRGVRVIYVAVPGMAAYPAASA